MKLLKEKIHNYRNILDATFEPSPTVTVICGENGQGKTNLLESIFLLSGAKSFRRAKDREMIGKDGPTFTTIDASFYAQHREQEIHLSISEKGRMASLNKTGEKKAAELVGSFCCVVFSPDHLELVKGNPGERRRFLDTALCQLSSKYLHDLRMYTRTLQQRNILLKEARNVSAAFDLLDVYDETLAASASELTIARRVFLEQLRQKAADAYGQVSGNREALSMTYASTLFQEKESTEEAKKRLFATRSEDLRMGYTTIGPHRDDITMLLNGEDARSFASQGQQRTIVLSMKLAEAQMFESKLDEAPVLLLDDFLSELDENRQTFLLERLEEIQAIITCCEPNFIERKTGATVYRMDHGQLEKVN